MLRGVRTTLMPDAWVSKNYMCICAHGRFALLAREGGMGAYTLNVMCVPKSVQWQRVFRQCTETSP